MSKTRFLVQREEGDNVDKLVKMWKKKVESSRLLLQMKKLRFCMKPKEKRKISKALRLYLQRIRTAEKQ